MATPAVGDKILLHCCCAPCSGAILEAMASIGVTPTIYFYNPNIHPQDEYERRKQELIRFAQKHGLTFVDADYDPENWLERVKGLENEPERGARCTKCFNMRLERTALHAHENGFRFFATTLGISRWKDMEQVYASGHRAAAAYAELIFWDYNWRQSGGAQRMLDIAKEEKFYQQEYCGCLYSLRDANARRHAQGREVITPGTKRYGESG